MQFSLEGAEPPIIHSFRRWGGVARAYGRLRVPTEHWPSPVGRGCRAAGVVISRSATGEGSLDSFRESLGSTGSVASIATRTQWDSADPVVQGSVAADL